MPNCDFYASGPDIDQILELAFDLEEASIFESYSPFDEQLRRFDSPADVAKRYPEIGLCRGNGPSVQLSLCPNQQVRNTITRRIDLDRSKVKNATFREAIDGWGLIQLHIGGVGPRGLVHSHTNHNSMSRALKWAGTYPEFGPVDDWDFKLVSSLSRRLNHRIHKHLAVDMVGSRPVLKDAKSKIESGLNAI